MGIIAGLSGKEAEVLIIEANGRFGLDEMPYG